MTRKYAFDMLARVQDELESARFGVSYVIIHWQDRAIHDAAIDGAYTRSGLRRCAEKFEMTYILRLFSQFEATLRDYWRNGMGRTTEPGMFDLMESVAAHRNMNRDDIAAAHVVRELRNDLAHENIADPQFDFPACLRRLGRYLRWLPLYW